MTRRGFFAAAFGVTTTATHVTAAGGIHINAVLQADNQSGDGYYATCGENACSAEDAIGISVHPKGRWAKDFAAMANQRVQLSIFVPTV